MAAAFRILCLFVFLIVLGCTTREDAMHQGGLQPLEGSHIPLGTPGPGIEKIKSRPDSTPTPTPSNPMDKPLDPTGLPEG